MKLATSLETAASDRRFEIDGGYMLYSECGATTVTIV